MGIFGQARLLNMHMSCAHAPKHVPGRMRMCGCAAAESPPQLRALKHAAWCIGMRLSGITKQQR